MFQRMFQFVLWIVLMGTVPAQAATAQECFDACKPPPPPPTCHKGCTDTLGTSSTEPSSVVIIPKNAEEDPDLRTINNKTNPTSEPN